MPTLAQYRLEVRRLLHDANANFYQNDQLNDHINDARNQVVSDTGCNRALQSFSFTSPTEVYQWSALPQGSVTLDILNITVLWSNMRVTLRRMSFTELNMSLRPFNTYMSRPIAWSVYGQSFYIAPVPDQTYAAEIDTVVLPSTLINDNDPDTLIYPFTVPVAYFAASKAKLYEQSFAEAEQFMSQYTQKVRMALRASMTRQLGI